MRKRGISAAFLACALAMPAGAGPADNAVDLLIGMVKRVREVGQQQAMADFAGKANRLATLDPVIFCVGSDGTVTASGPRPAMVNRATAQRSDQNGRDLREELLAMAQHPGFGEVSYRLQEKGGTGVVTATTFIQRVAGQAYCGVDIRKNE